MRHFPQESTTYGSIKREHLGRHESSLAGARSSAS
jgi:hypothetical protein